MDVTNAAEKTEWDHPAQVTRTPLSESVESVFDGNTVRSAEVTFRSGERTTFHTHGGIQVLYVTEGGGNRGDARRRARGIAR